MELEQRIKLTKTTKGKDTQGESTQSPIAIPPKPPKLIDENSPIIKGLKEAEEKVKNTQGLSDTELIEREFKDNPEVIAIRAKNKTLQYANNSAPLQKTNIADYIESSQIPQTRNMADMEDIKLGREADFVANEVLDEPPFRSPLPQNTSAHTNDSPNNKPPKERIDRIDLSDLLPDSPQNTNNSPQNTNNPPRNMGSLGLIDTREGDFALDSQASFDKSAEITQYSRESSIDSRQDSHTSRDSHNADLQNAPQNQHNFHNVDSYSQNSQIADFPQNAFNSNNTPHIIDDIARSENSDAIVGIYTPDPHDLDGESHHRVEFVDKIDSYDIEIPKNRTLYDNILGDDIIDTTDDIDTLNEINNSLSRAQKRLEEKIKIAKLRQKLGDIKSVTPIEQSSAQSSAPRGESYNVSANTLRDFGAQDSQDSRDSQDSSEELFIDFSQNANVDFSPNAREFAEREGGLVDSPNVAQEAHFSDLTIDNFGAKLRESAHKPTHEINTTNPITLQRPSIATRNEALEQQNNANFAQNSTQNALDSRPLQDLRESSLDSRDLGESSHESNINSQIDSQDSRKDSANDEFNENFFDSNKSSAVPPNANQSANQSVDSSTNQSTNYYTSQSVDSSPNQSYAMPNPHSTSDFTLPPLDLLNPPLSQKIDIDDSEIDIKVQNLFNKLRVFKIEGDIVRTYSGPVVTTFEFRPAPNVKVSRIQNLQDDLSMALKATSIRIQAPIPGKDVVGIEIPNNKIQTIYLREIFESDEYRNATANLPIALGKDVIGNPVIEDLAKLPHLLIAGTTGSGKSVGINAMILSLLYRHTPKDLRFIMIDPKFLEFGLYKDIPHLLTPIITDPKKAIIALSKAVEEMNRRYELMDKAKVKTIVGYNEVAEANGEEKLPYIVIIIDEFADLMIMGGREAEQFLISLAGKARASGIHLIIATQRPTVNVVTGLIKGNLPSKISYRVGSKIDSKVILEETGAEALLGRGDLLFSKTNNIVRLHAPYNDEREIERIVEFLKAQQEVQYDEFFSLEQKEPVGVPQPTQISSEGDYKERAKEIILQSGKTSISYLQRGLGVGFNKAASIIESLEKDGFLSPPNSKGVREIIGN